MNKSVLRAVGLIAAGLALCVISMLAEEAPRNASAKQDASDVADHRYYYRGQSFHMLLYKFGVGGAKGSDGAATG